MGGCNSGVGGVGVAHMCLRVRGVVCVGIEFDGNMNLASLVLLWEVAICYPRLLMW